MADPKAIFDEDDATQTNEGMLDAQPTCLKCGVMQQIMKCCTRCHSAYYCSRPCFVQHWPLHKQSCQLNSKKTPGIRNATHSEEVSNAQAQEQKTLYRVVQRDKPAVETRINFQKAADALKDIKPTTESKDNDADLPGQEIVVRYSKQKHRFKVCDVWEPQVIFCKLSAFLMCLPDSMRLIHKGRQLTPDTVRASISPGNVFQVLGERMEDEGGLDRKDVDTLMKQMGLERNVAVRALRNAKGDLIDAIMTIGNK